MTHSLRMMIFTMKQLNPFSIKFNIIILIEMIIYHKKVLIMILVKSNLMKVIKFYQMSNKITMQMMKNYHKKIKSM